MVSSKLKSLQHLIPFLGTFALFAMFLKLPEIPDFLGAFTCKTCTQTSLAGPLLATAYFTALIAVSLLFPTFPSKTIAKGGLVWAILLAVTLTLLSPKSLCIPCIIGHVCNILIWILWLLPHTQKDSLTPIKERLALLIFAPLCIVGLFASLNLTFLIYGLKNKHEVSATSLKEGDAVPVFTAFNQRGEAINNTDMLLRGRFIVNFISPNCPFCKEQLNLLTPFINQSTYSNRFINVTPSLPAELLNSLPGIEWIEDSKGVLREQYKIKGYPTLLIIGDDNKIQRIIPGVPENLITELKNSL